MKLQDFLKGLMDYFTTDITNLSNYFLQAKNMRDTLQAGMGTVKPEHFKLAQDDLNKQTITVNYLQNRIKEAKNYKIMFKKIFSNKKLSEGY